MTARRIEQVPVDRSSALGRLTRAEEKLDAARKIAEIDIEVAYVTAYDAMRIAVTAHMLSLGYRVRAVAGAHEARDCILDADRLRLLHGRRWIVRRRPPARRLTQRQAKGGGDDDPYGDRG